MFTQHFIDRVQEVPQSYIDYLRRGTTVLFIGTHTISTAEYYSVFAYYGGDNELQHRKVRRSL